MRKTGLREGYKYRERGRERERELREISETKRVQRERVDI